MAVVISALQAGSRSAPERQTRRLLAAILPVLMALSGCMGDDAYLARGGSGVDIPGAPGGISPSHGGLVPSNGDRTGRNSAGRSGDRRYFAAIGKVVLRNHAGNDLYSSPDVYVEVQRRDRTVLDAIRRAEGALSMLRERKRDVDRELAPLRTIKRNSELIPGEPLSSARVQRLAELSGALAYVCEVPSLRNTCRTCEPFDERPVCLKCEDCRELRFLLEKKAAADIVPGPPLGPAEQERLRELEESSAGLARKIRETFEEMRRLWDGITGRTHVVTTPGFTLDYGFRPIQEVFPGDEIRVAVYDADLGDDDLYGSTMLHVRNGLLQGDEVELSMPNVRSLVIRVVFH